MFLKNLIFVAYFLSPLKFVSVCEYIEGEKNARTELLKSLKFEERFLKNKKESYEGVNTMSYLYLDKDKVVIHELKQKIDSNLMKENFNWKTRILTKLSKNSDFPYDFNCFGDESFGYIILIVRPGFRSVQEVLPQYTLSQLKKFFFGIINFFKSLHTLKTTFTQVDKISFLVSENDITKPYVMNYGFLQEINRHCFIPFDDYKTKEKFSFDLPFEKREFDGVTYAKYKALYSWNFYDIVVLIKLYKRNYVNSSPLYKSKYTKSFQDFDETLHVLYLDVLNKKVVPPTWDVLDYIVNKLPNI